MLADGNGHEDVGSGLKYNRSALICIAGVCGMVEASQELTSAYGSFVAVNIEE